MQKTWLNSCLLFILVLIWGCVPWKMRSADADRQTLVRFQNDTLQYIQKKFIDNKKKYIGKNLNTLLADLEIPVKSYYQTTSFLDPKVTPSIYLEFYSSELVTKKIDRPDKPTDLIIRWSPFLPKDSVDLLMSKSKGAWTEAEKEYFGKQIVGDVLTTNYSR